MADIQYRTGADARGPISVTEATVQIEAERDHWAIFQSEGISDAMIKCFVTYLAGYNRPTHEVLFSKDKAVLCMQKRLEKLGVMVQRHLA